MVSVKVRNLEIGVELPKICVPIVDKTEEEILESARKITETKADLVEWRVDWFEGIFDFEEIQEILGKLREILGERPVLFTCRTAKEGGQISLTKEQYMILNQCAIESGYADLIDIEVMGFMEMSKCMDETKYLSVAEELIKAAHAHGVKVVGSNHDFQSTPSKEEIIRRLVFMQDLGVDIPKIAVMPQNKQDVLTLLCATEEMVREHGSTPVVTMSMGAQGVISRIAGKVFGSAMTFGTVGKASAPGQIAVEDLRTVMKILR